MSSKRSVCRCPKCGSTNAGPDESRSRVDFTFMECRSCGEGGLYDSWERDFDWYVDFDGAEIPEKLPPLVTPPERMGCTRCAGDDAAVAWSAIQSRRVRAFVEESHFSLRVSACSCGQHFAIVFTERVDWSGGEDAQDWLGVPISQEELATLTRAEENALPSTLTRLAEGRRFLVRSFPTGGGLETWWRESGFRVGPHD